MKPDYDMNGPVVLLSIDTLRQDVFNKRCFEKSWDIITSDFTRYPNAHSHGVATPHAFPGIISAHPVTGDGELPTSEPTIAELFTGYTVGFTNNGHLRESRGYNRGFDQFGNTRLPTSKSVGQKSIVDKIKDIDRVQNSEVLRRLYNWYQAQTPSPPYSKDVVPAETVTEWTLSELDSEPPEFIWSHYMDTHKPFIPEHSLNPPNVEISKEKLAEINDYEREDDPPLEEHRNLLWELYKATARYLDRNLANLLRELQTKEWYDEALLILVADHGELFGEYDHMWHPMTIDPVDELINTPLAVKYPEQRYAGDVQTHQVHHTDIITTIASHLDRPDVSPQGTHPLYDTDDRITISKSNTSIRVTSSDGHAIRRRDGTQDATGNVSDKMQEKLDNAVFPNIKTMAGEVRGLEDERRIEQLKALGYR